MKTKFKLFENKSSLYKRDCRLVQGGVVEQSYDKLKWWEREIYTTNHPDDVEFKITTEYQNRPDLISFLFYGVAKYDWLILQYNNIIDIVDELSVGKTIIIPSMTRVTEELTSKVIKINK